VVKFDDDATKVVADIPGIIEGAHEGRGLGLDFLKHVERTKSLLHVIDFAAVDGRDPLADYQAMNKELAAYSPKLAEKPQIIVANKMDLPEARENLVKFRRKVRKKTVPISAATGEGVKELLNQLRSL
jgi:GTP-binding protein